jgi:hypothetical protein
MRESSGTTLNEQYISERNATLTNGPTWNNTSSDGPCVSFDGSNDYANASFSGLTSKPFTITLRAKATDASSGSVAFFTLGFADGANRNGINLSVNRQYGIYTAAQRYGGNDSSIQITSTTGILGAWSVFGVSVATGSNNSVLRINALKQIGTFTDSVPAMTRLTIAASFNSLNTIISNMPALIKDFRIYNRVLSDSEFEYIANRHG